MLKFILDENITPIAVGFLWEKGFDTYALRDRGLLGISDHELWRRAQEEGRTVVTINAGDFKRLAMGAATHSGVVTLPAGTGRDEQVRCIGAAVNWARDVHKILPSFRDTYAEVDISLTVSAVVCALPSTLGVAQQTMSTAS